MQNWHDLFDLIDCLYIKTQNNYSIMGNEMCSAIQNEKPSFKQRIKQKQFTQQTSLILKELNLFTDDSYTYKFYRMNILKMLFYGQNHLIEHLKNQKSLFQKQLFMNFWKNINYEELDLYYQNLIKKEKYELYIDNYQLPRTIQYEKMYENLEDFQVFMEKGMKSIKNEEVAIFLFTNYAASNLYKNAFTDAKQASANLFDQFTDLDDSHANLFSLTMKKLYDFAEAHDKCFPLVIVYYRAVNHSQITSFMKNFKYSGKIKLCMQETKPILNENGQLCLKGQFSHDFIQAPKGQHDFLNASCKGQKVIDILHAHKKKVGIVLNCMNIGDRPIDSMLIGSLNQSDKDVYYKCINYNRSKQQKCEKRYFKRVVLCENFLQIKDYEFFQKKAFLNNLETVQASPLWLGNFIFKINNIYEANKKYYDKVNIDALIETKRIYLKYWDPYVQKNIQNQMCYQFSKDITNLFMNSYVNPLGIQVQQEDYFPVFSKQQFKKKRKLLDSRQENKSAENIPTKMEKDQKIDKQ